MSGGLRLLLVVAAPLAGALAVHELRHRRRGAAAAAGLAIAVCAALTASLASAVSAGGSIEHNFGTAIPGVDFTARADSASVAAVLVACLAALLAVPRAAADERRLRGLLLCLAGTSAVAAAGNLALVAGGASVVAAGTLLMRGHAASASRTVAVAAALVGAAALALLASAAQLVAGAGSSDLAFLPQGAVGGALAVPWALGGVALLASPAMPGGVAPPARDWAATGALPSGFLVLLRLQQSAGGRIPGNAAVTLAVAGLLLALAAASSAMRTTTVAGAGYAGVGIVVGVMASLFGSPIAATGTVLATLLLALELALIAAPGWTRSPTAWSAASAALLVLPGGAAFAAAAVGLGVVVQRGAGAYPQLAGLTLALAAAAVAAGRAVARAPRGWRPAFPGAVLAAAAGLAGGLLPGLAFRSVAAPLAGGATTNDIDAGAIQGLGAGFAGGYFGIAATLLLMAAGAAAVVVGGEPIAAAAPAPRLLVRPQLRALLAARRSIRLVAPRAGTLLHGLDQWLESQPRLPLVVGAAALAVVLLR